MAAKRGGLAEERGEEKTEAEEEGEELWGKVVEMTQTAFREGKLAEEATWQTVVLIPKGKGEFREIGLVEVTWKVVAVILHRRLTAGIKLHQVNPIRIESCESFTRAKAFMSECVAITNDSSGS